MNRTDPSHTAKLPPPVWYDHMWYPSHIRGGLAGAWKYIGNGHGPDASLVPMDAVSTDVNRAQMMLSRFGLPRRPHPHPRSGVGGRSPNASVLLSPSVTAANPIFT